MRTFLQDLRYGARTLRNAPLFTFVAVATLALGIGANTAMFSVVDALLFRPPAEVGDPGRLVRLQMEMPGPPGEPAELSGVLSYPSFATVRDHARGFDGVAAFGRTTTTIGDESQDNRPSQPIALVTGDFFNVMRTRPEIGRLLTRVDDAEGSPAAVAVLSWDYWQHELGGSRSVLGSTVELNHHRFTIVGVARKHFAGVDATPPVAWVPLGTASLLGFDARMMRSRFASWLGVVGRVSHGTSEQQARAAVQAAVLAARDAGEEAAPPGELGDLPSGGEVRVEIGGPGPGGPGPGGPGGAGGQRRMSAPPPPRVQLSNVSGQNGGFLPVPFGGPRGLPVSLWFMAVTLVVLLIACANVANLLMARAAHRGHEMAVRLSLGASRGRIVSQLLTESVLLALMAGAAAVGVASLASTLLPTVLPLPVTAVGIEMRALIFTAAASLLTIGAFGLAPAVHAARSDVRGALAVGRTTTRGSRVRDTLVVLQLALSLVLLVGAGLFLRSLRNVKAIDPGFDAEQLTIANVDTRAAHMDRAQADAFWTDAAERVRAVPGVINASRSVSAPFEMNMMLPVVVPSNPTADGNPRPAQADFVDDRYFATMGIAVRAGRAFATQDATGAPVAIVNETFARRYFNGRSPVGECIQVGMIGPDAPCAQIVGVVGDVRTMDVTQPASPMLYRPLAQRPPMGPPNTLLNVRAEHPIAVLPLVRQALQSSDARVSRVAVRPITEVIAPQLLPWRIGTFVFSLLGALGALLAAIGLYGVVAFAVAQRTRELGVRIALGARSGDVVALVLRQGGRLVGIALVIGVLAAAAATRVFARMMYGVSALDPLVFLLMSLGLVAVALVATLVPARRAARVDPMEALRAE